MPHKHFDERLAGLEQRLLSMSHKVESLVEEAVGSFEETLKLEEQQE